jgi:uncharacterized membrane protein
MRARHTGYFVVTCANIASVAIVGVVLICVLGIALSVRSLVVLERKALWTSAGWLLTAIYLVAVVVKATLLPALPIYAENAALAALTIAFIVAGLRDERQAEPWWWPNHRGETRAERHGTT